MLICCTLLLLSLLLLLFGFCIYISHNLSAAITKGACCHCRQVGCQKPKPQPKPKTKPNQTKNCLSTEPPIVYFFLLFARRVRRFAQFLTANNNFCHGKNYISCSEYCENENNNKSAKHTLNTQQGKYIIKKQKKE